jgi:hypothetical protein
MRPETASDAAAWLDAGVLVYGPRKAGTTLFQSLLDGSDQLLVYPAELKLKYFSRHRGRNFSAAAYFPHSRVPFVKTERLSIEAYKRIWDEAARDGQRRPLVTLIRDDALAVMGSTDRPPANPALWCAKEVGGGHRDILAFWRRLFRPGKALFIVRDPLNVTRAVLNDRRRKDIRLSVRHIVHQVTDPLRTMRRQMRYLDDPLTHFTVYEDLVADPEREMRKVVAFLGLEWSPVFARPTLFGDPVVVRTASRQTTEVFAGAESWWDGLTAREERIVAATARVADALPHLRVDYPALRAAIAARHASTTPVRDT